MQDRSNLDELIRGYAGKLMQCIRELLPNQPNEAEFRQHIDQLLSEFCEHANLNPLAHAEYTIATGRADAVFNRFVIEYERPGTLSNNLSHRATDHAVKQVKGYITGLAKKQKHEINRIAGIAFDGCYIVFVRYRDGDFSVETPTTVTQQSLERFLRWLSSLASGIALTAENLNRDFSIEQLRTQNILRALTQGLDASLNDSSRMVKNLFDQWRLFFSQSIDYSEAFGGRKLEALKKWARKAGLTVVEAERTFFCLHTYFALLVKLIAWLALSRHLAVKLGVPSFGELVTADSETLRRRLAEMESGGIFRAFGITNLLEGDFFAWYLYAWNERIEEAIRELLERLDEYDPTTLSVVPEESRDLFKLLYHYLLPREIRHNLGEYYTPDWLAQRLLNQVDSEFFTADPHRNEQRLRQKLLNLRWLDPACGSGTFLLLIIARMKELGQALMVNDRDLLNAILNNVVGFDINPLAVIVTRVNYLLAISDLLQYRKGDITIPVYLTDSVRMPTGFEVAGRIDRVKFPTTIGVFDVPTLLCTKGHFDRFCDLLEESVQSEVEPESFLKRVELSLQLEPPEWTSTEIQMVRELYERMLELHRNGVNGLWARLLKNNFAPLTVGQFDYIVGNPPWVNWEHLPDQYRQSIAPLWADYKLFPHRGFDAILGKSKDDISILMTYVVADKLLKEGGRLGFVITQSVFKTAGGGKGFRRFRIPQSDGREISLRVVHVDDMVSLQPFEGASNRTAVMVLEKGKPTTYPVPYTVWRKVRGARFTYDSTLDEVIEATKRLNFVAEPVDLNDQTSPWLTARPKALRAVRKILGKSDYEAHAGAYTGGANAVYWVDIMLKRPDGLVVVRNITEGARVEVDEVTASIEPDLLYPLLRGRDVKRWRAEPSAWIIVTHLPGMRLNAIPEKDMQINYPHTYRYLKRFESVLRERAAFKRYFMRTDKRGRTVETGPFYSMFDVGDYTFAPWKVVWRYIASDFIVAVAGPWNDKPTVPNEKLMLVACGSAEEAHYLCALLNSSSIRLGVRGFFVETQIAPHVIQKFSIPRYDPSNPVHRRLAELSLAAHAAAKVGDEKHLKAIEAEIDHTAAKVWGLTDEELREIQQSLKDLEGTEVPT